MKKKKARRRAILARKTLFVIILIAMIITMIIMSVSLWRIIFSPIRNKVIVEAATDLEISVEMFLKKPTDFELFTFADETDKITNFAVGEYEIYLDNDNRTYKSTLVVQDTTAPTAEVLEGYVSLNSNIDAQNLLTNIEDFSPVEVAFANPYTFDQIADYNVEIILVDSYGNRVIYQTIIHCVDDTIPPVFVNVPILYLRLNQVDYDLLAGIMVTDNISTEIDITVENAVIDTSISGDSNIIIKARDDIGNETTAERKVVVTNDIVVNTMQAFGSTSEMVDERITSILAEITTATMTDEEKTRAIYNWILWNNSYRNDVNEDYLTNPYEYANEYIEIILRRGVGHCFHYSVLAGKLLQQEGYEVALIQGNGHNVDGSFTLHFWVKVKLGSTWYNFDPLFEELFYYEEDFFLVSDNSIYNITHEWDLNFYNLT